MFTETKESWGEEFKKNFCCSHKKQLKLIDEQVHLVRLVCLVCLQTENFRSFFVIKRTDDKLFFAK